MASPSVLLRARTLTVSDSRGLLLDASGLELQRGCCTVILGPSGSGKTLASLVVLGLLKRVAPELTEVSSIDWSKPREHLSVGYVPQGGAENLHPNLTIGEQCIDLIRQSNPRTLLEYLSALRLRDIDRILSATPSKLSGGMAQRVMLATALSAGADLLVLDEPTSALDPLAKNAVHNVLRVAMRRGVSVLLITHDLKEATALADLVYNFNGSKLESAKNVSNETSIAEIRFDGILPKASGGANSSSPVMSCQNAVFTPGHIFDEHNTSPKVELPVWQINSGDVCAVVGESGSGKTTVLRSLARLRRPMSGEVMFENSNLWSLDSGKLKLFRQRVQLMHQSPQVGLNPFMSVGTLLAEPTRIRRMPRPTRPELSTALESVGLPPEFVDRMILTLSYGQRQRVALARLVWSFPDLNLLLLDEPLSALDEGSKLVCIDLLRQKVKDGVSVICATHDLRFARAFCEKILVLRNGQHIETFSSRTGPNSIYASELFSVTCSR